MSPDLTQAPPEATAPPAVQAKSQAAAGGGDRLDLTVPLSRAEREEVGRHIWYEIDQYRQDTAPRRGNVDQWRNDYEMYPSNPSNRWEESANVCSPLTHIYCQSHTVRLNQLIVKADPPFAVIAKTQEALPYVDQIEEAMESILDEAYWEERADQVHTDLPVVGNCLMRVTHEVKYIRAPRFQFDQNEALFNAFTAAGQMPMDAAMNSLTPDGEGAPAVYLEWENVLVHAGVSLKMIPWEDSVLLPATARDYEDLYGIGERLMIRGSELLAGARAGRYYADEVHELLEMTGDDQPQDRQERMSHQGVSPTGGGTWIGRQNKLYENYLCYELCWLMDADGDGQMEWVIATIHWQTKRLLRCQYLPYEHGQAYYVPFGYFMRPREVWAMSVAEKIASIQDAATAVLNQLIDHGDLVLNLHGNWFYDGTTDFNPAKQIARMGQPIRVGNVDAVKVIDIGPIPQEHYTLYQLLKDMADLVTASSNPSLGKTTDTQKTLGEIQIVSGASNMIFEERASGVARSWAKVWDQVRWLAAQFGDNGQVKYRVTARPGHMIQAEDGSSTPAINVNGQPQAAPSGYGFGSIPAELLLSDVDLVPAGLKRLADMQSRLNQASVVQNTALIHPLLSQNLPALAIILDNFFQAVGFEQREKVMGLVMQYIQGVQQALQEQQAMGQAGAPPGGPPGSDGGPGGPPSPDQNPGLQGGMGNPQSPPTNPIAPQGPANGLEGGRLQQATAEAVQGQRGGP